VIGDEAVDQDLSDLSTRDDTVARIAGLMRIALQQREPVLIGTIVVEPAGAHDLIEIQVVFAYVCSSFIMSRRYGAEQSGSPATTGRRRFGTDSPHNSAAVRKQAVGSAIMSS
jgi:hypothetical protein